MELAFITLRFDSPEEQEFVKEGLRKKFGSIRIENEETWDEDSGYNSWTELDVSSWTYEDIKEIYNLEKEWQEKPLQA